MRKSTRVISALLAAVLLLSVCAVSLAAEETAVYIPARISKLNLPDRPGFITLKTHTERAVMTDEKGEVIYKTNSRGDIKYDYNDNPIPNYGIVEGAEIELQFSTKPDWAGVIWAEGYESLTVDDTGCAIASSEGHMRQPGTWSASAPCDPTTGKPAWHVTGGDYAFMAGKGAVAAQYGRSGSVNFVEYTVEEDYFKTGMAGASTVIRYEPVKVETDCGSTTVWYVSSVTATYPGGNYIVGVRAEYRNDAKNTLASYTVSFAPSDSEVYKITYSPATTTILEDKSLRLSGAYEELFDDDDYSFGQYTVWPAGNTPSQTIVEPVKQGDKVILSGVYLHHYTEDEPLSGEYYKKGVLTAVAGSGKNLKKWYKPGHGRQVKGLTPCTSFKSPRVK